MRRLGILIIAFFALVGVSLAAGPPMLRRAAGPLVRKALKRTPLRAVTLQSPTVQLFPPLLSIERADLSARGSGESLGAAYGVRLGLRLSPSPLRSSIALNAGRIVLRRPLGDLTWEEGDARRFVKHLLVNLRPSPLEWSIGELAWTGDNRPKVTLRGLGGTLVVRGPDSFVVTARGRLEPSGSPPFDQEGALRLQGRLQRYYEATTFTGSAEWTPSPEEGQSGGASRLRCRIRGLPDQTLAKAALSPPTTCSVHPARPESRRFWTELVGRTLPGVDRKPRSE